MIIIEVEPLPKPKKKSKKSRQVNPQKVKHSRIRDPIAIKQARRSYCQMCGISKSSIVYEVHHIIKRSQGGDDVDENLINLCIGPGSSNCHPDADRGIIKKDTLREMKQMDLKIRQGRLVD